MLSAGTFRKSYFIINGVYRHVVYITLGTPVQQIPLTAGYKSFIGIQAFRICCSNIS